MTIYATLNPDDKSANITLSNGNLSAQATYTAWKSARATIGKTSGKWYWEVTIDLTASTYNILGAGSHLANVNGYCGSDAYGYGYLGYSGYKFHSASSVAWGAAFTIGDVIGVALDMDNGEIFWSKNGIWQASCNPETGANPAFTGLSGIFFPMVSPYTNTNKMTVNFGASAFSYSVPSGFNPGVYTADLLTASKGLKLEPDNTPLSGSMTEDAELIDDVLYTAATGDYWYYHYSYGLDLGSIKSVSSLICRAYVSNTPTGWYSSVHDSVTVYKSDDGSTWTEVETFDGPPLVHLGGLQVAFELEFSSSQSARYFKVRNAESSSTLAVNPGGASFQVSEIEAYSASGTTQLEDASLDLAAYYRKSEDLASFLRAHDGIELHDLTSRLEAADWSVEDLAAFLSAYYEELQDAGMDLSARGTHYDDLKSFLAAHFQEIEDFKSSLETWATGYADHRTRLEAADWSTEDLTQWLCARGLQLSSLGVFLRAVKHGFRNLAAFLSVTDGIVLNDLGCVLEATDGAVKTDLGLYLKVIQSIPAFRSVTAQKVSCVVHEVN